MSFLNPDPVACLVGRSNEASVIVDWQEVTALIDLGAKVSSIRSGFCECLALEVHPLGRLLELKGMGGSTIPYLGYVEVNLQIPGIKGYKENVLLLVLLTTSYSEKDLVGSKIIDQAMGMMTEGKCLMAAATWKQAHFSAIVSGMLQLHCTNSKEDGKVGMEVTPPQDLILQHPGCPAWMIIWELSIPLRRLPFPHLDY